MSTWMIARPTTQLIHRPRHPRQTPPPRSALIRAGRNRHRACSVELTMRALLLAALIPAFATAGELTETERNVIVGSVGGAVAVYGAVSTVLMMNDLLERGYGEPSHIVPAGFLALASFAGSTALLVNWARNRDEVGVVGGALMTASSLVMCFFVALSAHGWAIRQPAAAD